jgi:uncharacterized protein (DUF697 family)
MDLSKFASKAQGLLGKMSEVKQEMSIMAEKVTTVFNKSEDNNIENEDPKITDIEAESSEQEQIEKGSKMLQIMDWAFEKANGNVPGFGTSQEMAQKYLNKYGSVHKAIDKLINWQITSAATDGFVTNLGGLPAMPLTLPANIAGVMAIQLRMIGAIAELGGFHENTEEKKTGMYLCLLGSQAGDVLSKTASQFAIKFATASLKKLPGAVLTKINQQIGFRLLTKFGEKGLLNIHKAIPILGGLVGGTVDALSTYSIAKAAKALFLNEIIEFEKQEQIEVSKVHFLINLAKIDSNYGNDEKVFIKTIVEGLNISQTVKEALLLDVENPKKFVIDMTPFQEDYMLATSTLYALTKVAEIGGVSPIEQIYLRKIGVDMGCNEDDIKLILQSSKI